LLLLLLLFLFLFLLLLLLWLLLLLFLLVGLGTMEFAVSLLGSRNLSQSALIARNLYATLQVGSATHVCTQVEAADVPFRTAGGAAPACLVITLRNGQTQTVMYVRDVPLSRLALASPGGAVLWVAVYSPGDPRNLAFDESAPQPEVPQVHLCVRRVNAQSGGAEIGALLQPPLAPLGASSSSGGGECGGAAGGQQLARQAVETAAAAAARASAGAADGGTSGGWDQRPSALDREALAIREKERLAEDIKEKVTAMRDAKRQAHSTEQQLQEAIAGVEEMRLRLETAEGELQAMSARRTALAHEKQVAREGCAQAQEALRARDINIMEMRNARDEADRRFSSVLAEREREQHQLESSTRAYDDEVRGLSAERQRWRVEEEDLAEALQRCERRVQELQRQGEQLALQPTAGGGGEELRALRLQLDEALAELEAVRRSAAEEGSCVDVAEEQRREIHAKVSAAEATATDAKSKLAEMEAVAERERRRSAAGVCGEADATKRELSVQMARAAQLEGQLGENRNQLRELDIRIAECLAQVKDRTSAHSGLEDTVAGLHEELKAQELEVVRARSEAVACKESLQVAQADTDAYRSRCAELETSRREADLAYARRADELEGTQRVADGELVRVTAEVGRLREEQEGLASRAAGAEAEADGRGEELRELGEKAGAAEKELASMNLERAQREKAREKAGRRLAELEVELGEARTALGAADVEAVRLRHVEEAADAERLRRQQALDARVEQLRAEVKEQKAKIKATQLQHGATLASLEESRLLVPERREKVEELQCAGRRLADEEKELQAAIRRNRSGADQRAEAAMRLRDTIALQKLELGTAATDSSSGVAREAELRRSYEASRCFWSSAVASAQSDVIATRHTHMSEADELVRLRSERSKLVMECTELAASCQEVSERLAELTRIRDAVLDENASGVRSAEEEFATCEEEESKLGRSGYELTEKYACAEIAITEETRSYRELEADSQTQRSQLENVRSELKQCDEDIAMAQELQTSEAAKFAALQHSMGALSERASDLSERLTAVEAGASLAEQLRHDVAAATTEQVQVRAEHTKSLAARSAEVEVARLEQGSLSSSGAVAEKNAELDRRIESIDELEREVMTLTGCAETFGSAKGLMLQRLDAAEAQERAVNAEVLEQRNRSVALQLELEMLEERRQQLEVRVMAARPEVSTLEDIVRRCGRDAREETTRVAELLAKASRTAEEHEGRLQAMRNEAVTQARRNTETNAMLAQLHGEYMAAHEDLDRAKMSLRDFEQRCTGFSEDVAQVRLDQQAMEKERCVATEQAEQQLASLEALEEEAKRFPSTSDQLATEMQMVSLLEDQLASRKEALAKLQAEAHDLEVSRVDLATELEQAHEQLSTLEDKLAYQVEHSNLQDSTLGRLEEEIHKLEGEAEVLTLGLHDAEQRGEFLQKENYLMKQQVEGLYEGTLQDWAAEVHRIKVAAEVERHKDELNHWKQVTQEVERELHSDVTAAQQQHDGAEAELRRKIDALGEELSHHEQRLGELDQAVPEAGGSIHSVPASLHGLVTPKRELPANHSRRRALLVGCNYRGSRIPLQGCMNDVWNLQCLLRHSLQYAEDQVRCLVEGPESCPSPPSCQPTRANILQGIQWLTSGINPEGQNLLFYFGGYGTQQPQEHPDGLYEAHLVPVDFAEDLPAGFLDDHSLSSPSSPSRRPRPPTRAAHSDASPSEGSHGGCNYRLIPLTDLANAIGRLPPTCKATLILDCCHSIVPGIGGGAGGIPAAFPCVTMDPTDVVRPRAAAGTGFVSQLRLLQLPPLPRSLRRPSVTISQCCCHCYSACDRAQWCAELLIEGCVQGAFTFSFVKALTAGHLRTTVHQHAKAMHNILGDLRYNFRWIEQTPVLRLSATAKQQDYVLL